MQGRQRRAGLSPFMKQSIIGLMVLVSLGFLGLLIFWVQNFSFGNRSYRLKFQFPNAGGMTPGTRVSYRGVKVGQVIAVDPEPEGVIITVEVRPADRLIPSNALIEASQSGLIGETSIDIIPLQSLPSNVVIAPPLDPDCDPRVILCNGSQVQGQQILDVNSLIRSLLKISNVISDPEVTATFRSTIQKTATALDTFNQLAGDSSDLLQQARDTGSINNLNASLQAIDRLAGNGSDLLQQARDTGSIANLNASLQAIEQLSERFGLLSDSLSAFVNSNQNQLLVTVEQIGQASEQLRVTLSNLDPVLKEVKTAELITNLEQTTANAVVVSENLRSVSQDLQDPQILLKLQQILDSARSALQNADKITSDLDQLTGNPEFRENVIKLINGLSKLVSSTQQLEINLATTQAMTEIAAELSQLEALTRLNNFDASTTPQSAQPQPRTSSVEAPSLAPEP